MTDTITINQLNCLRCDHKWFPRTPVAPAHCPKCKSPYWNKPRGNDGNNAVPVKHRLTCLRCGHEWKSNKDKPRQCPKCHSSYWDKARKETEK